NVSDFTSADQVRQAAQVEAINQQTVAINANTAANLAQTAQVAADNATRFAELAAILGQTSKVTQDLATASSALQQVTDRLQGVSNLILEPLPTTFVSQTIFDQQNDRLTGGFQGRTPWGM